MDIKELLFKKEFILYEKFLYRKELKEKRKIIEASLRDIMNQLDNVSDVNIWKELWLHKQAIGLIKSNLHIKCKRLWINFNI